jgi:hypothetical protein
MFKADKKPLRKEIEAFSEKARTVIQSLERKKH